MEGAKTQDAADIIISLAINVEKAARNFFSSLPQPHVRWEPTKEKELKLLGNLKLQKLKIFRHLCDNFTNYRYSTSSPQIGARLVPSHLRQYCSIAHIGRLLEILVIWSISRTVLASVISHQNSERIPHNTIA